MDEKEAEFRKRLQDTFKAEAEEHARAISAGVDKLGTDLQPEALKELVETVFRETHSLKGAARVVNLADIESICQPLESVFSALKRGEPELSPELTGLLRQAADAVARLAGGAGAETAPEDRQRDRELKARLESAAREIEFRAKPRQSPAAIPPPVSEAQKEPSTGEIKGPASAATVRIPTARLDQLLAQAEEMRQMKALLGQRLTELRQVKQTSDLLGAELAGPGGGASATDAERRVSREKRELALNRLRSQLGASTSALAKDQHALGRMADEQLETVKTALMLPVSSLLDIFPKFVRGLARGQGKEAELLIRGGEVEIDKRILDELKDPLIHLLRNCVDHGLQKPAERTLRGKPAAGAITLSFSAREGRQIEILVSDDGAGMDTARIKAGAVKAGLISEEAAALLNADDALALIFRSGVSTSPIITDLSGRGLGLAIVREKIHKLGGSVSVQTGPDGTVFSLLLPLTLSAFRGVPVSVREQLFIFPAGSVRRVVRVAAKEIKTVENRETIQAGGRVIPLVKLADALSMPAGVNAAKDRAAAYFPAVIACSEDSEIAFTVDDVLGEQEFLVKSLGAQLARVLNISGAAVMGGGRIAPVLDVRDLLKSAVRAAEAGAGAPPPAEEGAVQTLKILVADDSITSRTLLKNILETAGYQVAVAVDGEDAFAQAREGGFDLVVSDVDMPRMNGFELTAKIRADRKLAELPVVLVTALESSDDQARGIDAGATAYIMKSSFDQSNLLEVVSKLI